MALGILTLLTALSISAVAIYYSVAGLVAIFAAAAIPIMIMGGVLEVGKLVTAVWLHKHWSKAAWWLRTYLASAVFVLMLITSMGIFGFLSKAHIEQTSAGEESVAQIERIEDEITRYIGQIGRAENKIRELESSTFNNDTQIQEQIDKEQERIDTAYDRIQPAIDEQNAIIANVTQLFQNELDKIDADLETLQGYIDNGETKKAQQMIGASADGIFGAKTADKIGEWQDAKRAERNEWLQKIQDAANSPTVVAARDEIQRLRSVAEENIAQSNELINRLRSKLGTDDVNLDELLDEQFERVRTANAEIETLTDQKFELQAEYRKLEAEVGPIKYIAEFVYGEDADRNMLEEAVRWVIITIIFVFDPLAVLLLIASQYTFEWRRSKDDNGDWLRQYEQARAQRIVDNPGYNNDDPKEDTNENSREEDSKEESQDAEELRDGEPKESVPSETGDDPVVATEKEEVDGISPAEDTHSEPGTNGQDAGDGNDTSLQEDNLADNESTVDTVDEEPVPTRETVEEDAGSTPDDAETVKEYPDTRNAFFYAGEIEQSKKKDLRLKAETETPEEKQRREYVDALESDATISERKRQWKLDNPNENLKSWKTLYIQGRIDKLPWIPEEGYVQNGEQSENTIWNRLKKD